MLHDVTISIHAITIEQLHATLATASEDVLRIQLGFLHFILMLWYIRDYNTARLQTPVLSNFKLGGLFSTNS